MFVPLQQGKGNGAASAAGGGPVGRGRETTSLSKKTIDENEVRRVSWELEVGSDQVSDER